MKTKHPLQVVIEMAAEETEEFECRSYSGRGMYGATCLGIDTGRGCLGALMAAIVANTDDDNREEVADGLRDMRTDSMGWDRSCTSRACRTSMTMRTRLLPIAWVHICAIRTIRTSGVHLPHVRPAAGGGRHLVRVLLGALPA